MATNRPVRRFQNVTNDFEIYTLIWFGKNVISDDENVVMQKRLKEVINQFKVFDDLNEYVDYLTDLVHQKVVFIVSETSRHIVIPVINDFPQLKAVYVYNFDGKSAED
jgi:3-phosphoglycerate kinase